MISPSPTGELLSMEPFLSTNEARKAMRDEVPAEYHDRSYYASIASLPSRSAAREAAESDAYSVPDSDESLDPTPPETPRTLGNSALANRPDYRTANHSTLAPSSKAEKTAPTDSVQADFTRTEGRLASQFPAPPHSFISLASQPSNEGTHPGPLLGSGPIAPNRSEPAHQRSNFETTGSYGRRDGGREPRKRTQNGRESVETAWSGRPAAPSNLSSWAPAQAPERSSLAMHNLPEWDAIKASGNDNAPTSLPNTSIIRDLDYSMRRLLNERVFEELLDDPLGRHRFREWLCKNEKSHSVGRLDMWLDTRTFGRLLEQVKQGSLAMHDMYLASGSPSAVRLPLDVSENALMSLRTIVGLDASFEGPQAQLLTSLYHNEFQRFIKSRIVETAHVRLGKFNLNDDDREGLGDCFCLTNPRMRDHPICLVSAGFERVTGYSKENIVGRNCRFLQGPGTSPSSVQRIRDGLNYGEGCTELLLNYRRDGTPFYCLLCIIPLRDSTGALSYFIGGQVNVTGLLAGSSSLSFLIAGGEERHNAGHDENAAVGEFGSGKYATSPSMQFYMGKTEWTESSSVRPNGSNGVAAGSLLRAQEPGPDAGSLKDLDVRSVKSARKGLFGLGGGGSKTALATEFPSQAILGAEGGFAHSMTIEESVKAFSATYSRVLLFRTEKREVIFATKQLLAHLGLPVASLKDLYKSSLIHADFLRMVCGNDKDQTNLLRLRFKASIRQGQPVSQKCRIKAVGRKTFFGREVGATHTAAMLHLTPLVERNGSAVAYVVVFA